MPKRKKVYIFSLYGDEGPSSKYRVFQYIDSIKEYADVIITSFWNNDYLRKYNKNRKKYAIHIMLLYIVNVVKRIIQLLFIAPRYDVIIIQKAVIPKIKIDFLFNILKKNKKIIFDVDDAVFVDKRDNTDSVARKCDIVFCGSKELYCHYIKDNEHVFFLPTVDNDAPYKELRHDTFDNKIIGWLGTSINLKNLDIVVDSVNNIIERHPEVSFHLICDIDGGYGDKFRNFKFIKWNKYTVLKEMSEFSVGIMPLEDNEINRGKCGFKLIQYMTMGKPVVGSPVGENKTIIKYGGLTATSKAEWEKALEELLMDQKKYYSYCKNIEDSFFENYSFNSNCRIIQKAIQEN